MQSIPMERTQAQVQVNAFVRSVYNWMAIGLALTGAVAWFVAHNEPVLCRVVLVLVLHNQRAAPLAALVSRRTSPLRVTTLVG